MASNFRLRTIQNSYCRNQETQRWGKIWETLAREFPINITRAVILLSISAKQMQSASEG